MECGYSGIISQFIHTLYISFFCVLLAISRNYTAHTKNTCLYNSLSRPRISIIAPANRVVARANSIPRLCARIESYCSSLYYNERGKVRLIESSIIQPSMFDSTRAADATQCCTDCYLYLQIDKGANVCCGSKKQNEIVIFALIYYLYIHVLFGSIQLEEIMDMHASEKRARKNKDGIHIFDGGKSCTL